jgi:ubiquinone/menaquinone biosynthesis C-methylase UbiE
MTASDPTGPPAGRPAALAQYRRRAPFYDAELAVFEPLRREAIARLGLRPGDTVLDVGCGTGLSLALLHQGVGEHGRIVGIEQSPEMIAQARQRVQQQHWPNVTLIEAPAGAARCAAHADAALLHFTHDILRDPAALAHLMRGLKPGARVVACGLKWASPWAWPMNLFVLGAALHSVTSLAGLVEPWNLLAPHLDHLALSPMLGGAVFIASGTLRQHTGIPKP